MKLSKLSLLIIPLILSSCGRGNRPTTSKTNSSSQDEPGTTTISLVAVNDLHGVVEPRNFREVGLSKLTTYLRNKKSTGSVLINSGDSYQGTFIAGYDKGLTVSKVFKSIDFDAYTLGNHEFDWGIDAIKEQEIILGQKYLGANVYNYPEKTKCADLGEPYKVKVVNEGKENEIRVGIIGVIGEDQISSITSTNTANITFVNPTPIVKELSNKLRDEENCDVVIADYHASFEQVDKNEISQCVDAVFLGHSHQETNDLVNGVPFLQGGRYGEAVSEISLSINKSTKKVTCSSHKITHLNDLRLKDDEEASKIINDQQEIIGPIGNKVIGNSNSYIDTNEMSCFYSKITYEKAVNLGYSPSFVLFNYSRYSLNSGDFTYSQLYETHPFMNKLYILSVNGYTIYREAVNFGRAMGYNPNSINLSELQNQKSTWYDVVVFDYNGFHINVDDSGNKYYDYFAASFTGAAQHDPIYLENQNVFDIAIEHLKENPTISSLDYSGSNFINYN